jgi:hypothetical protein
MLAGWDESGAPRSLIAGYAISGYLNAASTDDTKAMQAFQAANDVEGFFAFFEAKRIAKAAYFQAAGKACAAAGIPFKLYEWNQEIVGNAPNITDVSTRIAFVDWAAAIVHGERFADLLMRHAQAAEDAGCVEACFFNLAGDGGGSGIWGATPHVACDPYPIMAKLKAANASAQAAPADSWKAIATDLAALTARVNAMLAA